MRLPVERLGECPEALEASCVPKVDSEQVRWIALRLELACDAVKAEGGHGVRVEALASEDFEDASLADCTVSNHDQVDLFAH